ncbi:hypothetical protein JCM19000A_25880 [Silvimonas sp. JCM 19000]
MKNQQQAQRLALLAAIFAATAALAQAEVEIYGRINMDIENTLSGGPTATSSMRVANNTSRIGFRGYDKLDNGWKAIWQVENGIAFGTTTTGGNWGSRETFVGISAPEYGTFKAGNFLVPVDDLHGIEGNMFQYVTGISNDATLWLNGGSLATGGFDVRTSSSISYQTPDLHGFSSRIQYAYVADSNNQKTSGSVTSANAVYRNGNLIVAYGGQANRGMLTTSSGFYSNGYMNMLVGGYQWGHWYLAALLEHDELQDINRSGKDRERNYGSVTARYTLAPRHILTLLSGKASNWTGDAGVAESDATMNSLAYNYVLTPRAQVYLIYSALHNGKNGAYVLGGNAATSAQAGSQHAAVLGMWENF